MHETVLRELLEGVKSGETSLDHALERLRDLPFSDLGFAKVDHHRALRTAARAHGVPIREVYAAALAAHVPNAPQSRGRVARRKHERR